MSAGKFLSVAHREREDIRITHLCGRKAGSGRHGIGDVGEEGALWSAARPATCGHDAVVYLKM